MVCTMGKQITKCKENFRVWDSSTRASRHEEVLLTRLRIGHCHLTHGHLLRDELQPKYDICHVPLKTELRQEHGRIWAVVKRHVDKMTTVPLAHILIGYFTTLYQQLRAIEKFILKLKELICIRHPGAKFFPFHVDEQTLSAVAPLSIKKSQKFTERLKTSKLVRSKEKTVLKMLISSERKPEFESLRSTMIFN
ncbi:hypothetical protein ANN_26638 [Periplaneta americana]|uniref:Uncharacterized protein n=1 Tax=Periplaneta americana TaxID=6978 RepID=A0ABQ8RYM4_PERAM|nr:hypothetical protein ANN_26638 [Periplaneta americana]